MTPSEHDDAMVNAVLRIGRPARRRWHRRRPSGCRRRRSDDRRRRRPLFYFIFWISLFFFVLIVALMVVFVIRYRRRSEGEQARAGADHNLPLEIAWTVIPLLVVVVIFLFGLQAATWTWPPRRRTRYEIQVTGQKWSWPSPTPTGTSTTSCTCRSTRPVQLMMTSQDVIHSFFVPAFRVKQDVVPGRYTKAWFQATEAGEFDLYCAEYCGTGHSDMIATVMVQTPGDFETLAADSTPNLLDEHDAGRGRRARLQAQGLPAVPLARRDAGVGPDLQGRVRRRRSRSATAQSVAVDENYVRESILEPTAKVVPGFEPVMPTFKGRSRTRRSRPSSPFEVRSKAPRNVSAASVGGRAGGAKSSRDRAGPARSRTPAVPTRSTSTAPPGGTNYLNATHGWRSWLFTLDHKRIGVMYLVSILAASCWAGSSPCWSAPSC